MAKLNTNSNVYTVVYAAVMVIIVAFLLAFVASSLKEVQEANVANDTKGQILTALGYDKATIDVAAVYAEKVQDNTLEGGELKPYEGAFNTSYGALIKAGELHVFTAETADGEKAYVIPVTGRGLWGGLWGYIAVNAAKDTVLGTYFYHEGETAGLGALIGERPFQEQFIGRPIFQDGQVALTVVKSGQASNDYEVDGVTGATLTSNGVAAMVGDGLTAYADFLGAAAADVPALQGEGKCCGKCPKAEGECCGEGQCSGKCPKAEGECCGENCSECCGESCGDCCEDCCGECEKNNVEQ